MIIEHLISLLKFKYPIYVGDMPDSVEDCIAVFYNDGLDQITYFGGYGATTYPMVRFLIRSKVYREALTLSSNIEDKFRVYSDDIIPGIIQVGDAMYAGRDEKGRTIIILNFKIITGE